MWASSFNNKVLNLKMRYLYSDITGAAVGNAGPSAMIMKWSERRRHNIIFGSSKYWERQGRRRKLLCNSTVEIFFLWFLLFLNQPLHSTCSIVSKCIDIYVVTCALSTIAPYYLLEVLKTAVYHRHHFLILIDSLHTETPPLKIYDWVGARYFENFELEDT